jgi:hypothetical protein
MTATAGFAALTALSALAVARLPPLHPSQLWLVPWTVALGLFATRLLPYRPLSSTTVALIVIGSGTFTIATLAGERIAERGDQPTTRDSRRSPYIALIGLTVASAVLLVGFLVQVTTAHGVRATLVTSPDVRLAIQAGDTWFTIKYVYFTLGAIALAATLAPRAREASTRHLLLAVAAMGSVSLYFSTGRATVVAGLIAFVVGYFANSPKQLSRSAFAVALVSLAVAGLTVFIVGGHIVGKTYENNPDLQLVDQVFGDHPALEEGALPYQYATAPVAALDLLVSETAPLESSYGCAAFTEACKAFNAAGADLQVVPRIRPFTARPLPWNTYTAFDVPLLEGGLLLAVPIIAIVGFLVGWLWRRTRSGSGRYLAPVGYALSAPALLYSAQAFNFTAPHLIGAFFLVALALLASAVTDRWARRHLTTVTSRPRGARPQA